MPTSGHAAADLALADRIAHRDAAAFERLMRQHNQRLFRVARAILRDDADAEDALQDAYVQAYRKLGEFRGDAELGHVADAHRDQPGADARAASARATASSCRSATSGDGRARRSSTWPTSRRNRRRDAAMRGEVRKVLERRIDELPEPSARCS